MVSCSLFTLTGGILIYEGFVFKTPLKIMKSMVSVPLNPMKATGGVLRAGPGESLQLF